MPESDSPTASGHLTGRPIQIAKIDDNRRFALDLRALEQIVLTDKVRDKPVVVVSIAGDMRKGKSFMLNFFLRYLQSTYGPNPSPDWIGKQKNEPLTGFSWRGGSERDTTGIMMWSEPVIAQKDGKQVAILLMDTQGVFDSEHSVKEAAIIFALSLLTSSLFIYNLKHQLQENYLDYLHVFAEYGLLVMENNDNVKPFQKLVFLIRDWSFPYEFPYGETGGRQLLDKYLKEKKTDSNKRVRLFIERCFSETTCFLMPYPGNKVATHKEFKGRISNIDPEFVEGLEKFVPLMLGPNNLVVKGIGGIDISGRTLCEYFKTYSNLFSGDTLPEPKSMLEATAEVTHMVAVAEAEKHYTTNMEEMCGGDNPYVSPSNLKRMDVRFRKEAKALYEKTPKMGGNEFKEKHEQLLEQRLDNHFEHFEAQNANKDWLRLIRTPLILVSGLIISFVIYHLAYTTGIVPLAHISFVICAVLLGLFSTWVVSLKTGVAANVTVMVAVGVLMALLAIVFLYRGEIFYSIIGSFHTNER